jgi:hypothetical protein
VMRRVEEVPHAGREDGRTPWGSRGAGRASRSRRVGRVRSAPGLRSPATRVPRLRQRGAGPRPVSGRVPRDRARRGGPEGTWPR